MDLYDSDSSVEIGHEYTETNINLGYASKEPTGDTVSHLGGFPVRRAPLHSFHNHL
jgi:pre-rRNA-processing protein TSR4